MNTIYEELLERVERGERFLIDFEKRNLRVGKNYLIKNGEWDNDRKLIQNSSLFLRPLDTIEVLYDMYRGSLPSERSESKRRSYFKALPFDELTDEQMIIGLNREIAQARLEAYMLIAILKGLTWDDTWGNWYWASKKYPELIILKQWIVGKEAI